MGSIVAVAAPYWSMSHETHGMTMTSSVSLWTVSSTAEGNGRSADTDIDMCGDDMQDSEVDCGKISAVRFFTITALLMALASAVALLVAFSPAFRAKAEGRFKLSIVGAWLAGGT